MSGALEIVGSPSATGRIQSPSAQSVALVPAAAHSAQASATPIRTVNVIQDPAAGFITEYLSAHGGHIVSQIPSAITVAYLRQGLSEDGLRPPAVGSVTTTA